MAKNFDQLDETGTINSGDFVPIWQAGQAKKISRLNFIAGLGSPYTLPIASAGVLGGIRVGANLSIDGSGILSAAAPYTLPVAGAGTLGGVKVGSGLAVAGDGTLSTTYSYTLPTATSSVLGGVKVGPGLSIIAGVLGVEAPVQVESTTARAASLADAGFYTRFTNAAVKTYTFNSTTYTYVVGSEFHGRNVGAGNLTLTAAGGMVLNAPAGGTLVVPAGGGFTVKIVAAGEADVLGVTVAA